MEGVGRIQAWESEGLQAWCLLATHVDTQTCVDMATGPAPCTHNSMRPGLCASSQVHVHVITAAQSQASTGDREASLPTVTDVCTQARSKSPQKTRTATHTREETR